ncbi:MAG: cation transporter [Deltaproteobacteria bacterium]|nr:cation transporter [Deltaproteobacteria bacterium]
MSSTCTDNCEDLAKSQNRSKALMLEYFTVGYNVFEGIASIAAGILAGSIALIGFGLDSAIESASGGVLIWRLLKHGKIPPEEEEKVEKKAVRLVAYSFFLLAAYVTYESIEKLYLHEAPEPSLFGMIIAVLSIIIMPFLAYAKWKQGKKMGLRSLIADSKQTLICSMLSVALLIGLGLNYLYGLWWADPVSALVIVVLILKEGFKALKEEKLCTC